MDGPILLSARLSAIAHLKAYFQDDLFVPAAAGTAVLDAASWLDGADAELARVSLQPAGTQLLSSRPPDAAVVSSRAMVSTAVPGQAPEIAFMHRVAAVASAQGDSTEDEEEAWSD